VAIAAIRFALAAMAIGLWSRWTGHPLGLRPSEWRPALVVGVLLFAQISLFNVAIDWSNASHGTVLINVYVFFVIAIEHFITKVERLNVPKCLGLVLAAVGVLLTVASANNDSGGSAAVSAGDTPSFAGDLVMIASAMVLSLRVVYTKYTVQRVSPMPLVFWQHVIGTLLFVAVSVPLEGTAYLDSGSFTSPVVLGLLYQGVVVGGLCFVLHTQLLERYSATQISVFSFATPLFGVLFSVLMRGDPLTVTLLMAGAGIAAGIYLVTAQRPKRSPGDDVFPDT
jgi:drug/metabolite transporter (DMT)-like permease